MTRLNTPVCDADRPVCDLDIPVCDADTPVCDADPRVCDADTPARSITVAKFLGRIGGRTTNT